MLAAHSWGERTPKQVRRLLRHQERLARAIWVGVFVLAVLLAANTVGLLVLRGTGLLLSHWKG